MNITTKPGRPSGTHFYADGKFAGSVSQNPIHPDVADPGKWQAIISTADGGLWSLGTFDTEKEALDAATEGLKKNLSFEQWARAEFEAMRKKLAQS
jgi:hypothetical protein